MAVLGGTAALLLPGLYTIVNICVLVLRRRDVVGDRFRTDLDGNPLDDEERVIDSNHFRTPTVLPIIGALARAFLVTPFSGRAGSQYVLAAHLLALGVVLRVITWFANRALRASDGLGPGVRRRLARRGPLVRVLVRYGEPVTQEYRATCGWSGSPTTAGWSTSRTGLMAGQGVHSLNDP